MQTYQHIVIAVDLRDTTRAVIARAVALNGTCFQAKISLLHVAAVPVTGYGELTGKNHLSKDMQLRENLFAQLKALAAEHGVGSEDIFIEFGKVSERLQQFVKAHGCDLVIIGSHDKGGLGALLNRTDTSVLHHACCDVLTLKV